MNEFWHGTPQKELSKDSLDRDGNATTFHE